MKYIFISMIAAFHLTAFAGAMDIALSCKDNLAHTYTFEGFTIPLNRAEVVPEDEAKWIQETVDEHMEFYRRIYLSQPPQTDSATGVVTNGTRRGVHPYGHGGVRGKLTVNTDIAESDRVGIFAKPGHVYDVFARFSNGNPRPTGNDKEPDSRGFALKVFGVEGEHVIKDLDGADQNTQDFTMNSSQAFFADNAQTYQHFMRIGLNETETVGDAAIEHILKTVFYRGQVSLAWRIFKAFQGIKGVVTTNPLAINYYSISAFQHGEGRNAPIVKYSLQPCDGGWIEPVDETNPRFLRANLIAHINEKPACFRFMVQDQYPGAEVEDISKPWDEKRAPFRELARVEFPPQQLVEDQTVEGWVINPWNTLPAHKPVGGINRTRLASYIYSIRMRKKTNSPVGPVQPPAPQ